MKESPNYYAIIPANVRYDKNLKDKAKLLYGEISALSDKNGYCYATNKYFAELYNVSTTTISLLIKDLIDNEYIESEIIYKEGTKEILNRYLRIIKEGYLRKVKDNNTSINNICSSSNNNKLNNNIDSSRNININNNIYIYNYIETNYGRTISPLEKEKIDYWLEKYDEEIIKYAFEISVMNNAKRFNYVNKILQNWETSGYTTKNEILENEKVQSKKEENISKEEEEILNYNWFDEEY